MFDGKDNVQNILMLVIGVLGFYLMVSYVRDDRKCVNLKNSSSCKTDSDCHWTPEGPKGKCRPLLRAKKSNPNPKNNTPREQKRNGKKTNPVPKKVDQPELVTYQDDPNDDPTTVNENNQNNPPLVTYDNGATSEKAVILPTSNTSVDNAQLPKKENVTALFQNTEGFSNYSSSDGSFESFQNNNSLPSECYPKDVLSSSDLLPNDADSKWAQANPNGQGSLTDKNFLNAGYHVGVNTVGQSLRNANRQLRSDPPNPQVKVSPWMQTTIEPDVNRKPMEIGA
jgi:hypothetical protein